MDLHKLIQELPKVELYISLEGAIAKEQLLLLAEQNEVQERMKKFDAWIKVLDNPTPQNISEIIQVTSTWFEQPDDFSRAAYNLGVSLAKQNVVYAEIQVNPTLYTEHGISFEDFLNAINDGRSRAERGWNIHMRWILNIPWEYPRHADEIIRWAGDANAYDKGIVGVSLSGNETAQPVGQFERAFRTAAKKALPRIVHVGMAAKHEAIDDVLQTLNPQRLVTAGWGVVDEPEILSALYEQGIPISVSLAGSRFLGYQTDERVFPLKQLLNDGVPVVLGSGMPAFFNSSLVDEYRMAAERYELTAQEIKALMLNGLNASQLTPSEKDVLLVIFERQYDELMGEDASSPDTAEA